MMPDETRRRAHRGPRRDPWARGRARRRSSLPRPWPGRPTSPASRGGGGHRQDDTLAGRHPDRECGRVLVSRASEAEAKLSFTVLTDLLEPALNDVGDELPAPQRRALEAALLLEDPAGGAKLDARAVSLGALGALRALAVRTPVTLAIDDVQWTDAPSARALSFALRRLVNEPVTVVAARRTALGLRDPLDLAKTAARHPITVRVRGLTSAPIRKVHAPRHGRRVSPRR